MTTLAEQIRTTMKQNAETTRTKYFAALRSRDVEAIAAAAQAAGVSAAQVATDVTKLERADELTRTLARLPQAKRFHEECRHKSDAAEEKLRKTTTPLEEAAMAAAMQLQAAEAAVRDLHRTLPDAEALWRDNPELLPPGTEPVALREAVAETKRKEDEALPTRSAVTELTALRNNLAKLESLIYRITYRKYPYDVQGAAMDYAAMERQAPEVLAKAKEEAAAAQKRIAEIEADLQALQSTK